MVTTDITKMYGQTKNTKSNRNNREMRVIS